MLYTIKAELTEAVQRTLAARFGVTPAQYRVGLQYSARPEFGDFSLPFAFELARVLRQSPLKTAQAFLESFEPPPGVDRAEIAGGGYVNLFLKRAELLGWVLGGGFRNPEKLPGETDPAKYIVEHTNINPNKAAHVGHLRNAVLGDSLVRLMRFNGKQVEVQNYIDNTGVQVADVVVGFLHLEPRTVEEIRQWEGRFDYLCWDVYARVTQFYEQDKGREKLRADVLKHLEEGGNDVAAMAEEISLRIVNCHLDTMERLGIRYDVLPRESDILHLNFWASAFEQLRAAGVVSFETEGPNRGCWVMTYEKDGAADTKIMVRSNGTVTYSGKDLAYHLWKLGRLGLDFQYEPFRAYPDGHVVWLSTSQDPGPTGLERPRFGGGEWVFNVIDARQAYTQNVVYEGVRRLGFTAEADHSVHFAYEIVALSPRCAQELGFELSEADRQRTHVEVSGRKGLGVKADDLLDRLEEKTLQEVQSRNPDLDPDRSREIARQVAVGALRYFMVKFTRNSLIVFDFDDALNFDGETGPYLQYSAVRAKNVIQKYLAAYGVTEAERQAAQAEVGSRLAGAEIPPDVWELVLEILKFRDVARTCLAHQELSSLAKYLYALAQRFSNFYNRHRIIGEENVVLRHIFLAVVDIYLQVMRSGLEILGIPVPERM